MPNFFQNLASKPLTQGAMNTAQPLGSHIGGGLTLGVAGAATAGVGMAATKAYEALTHGRDFRAMMNDPFNKDLHEYHQRDPAVFNAAFNGLRKANHEMSANPMTAGSYMRRMMEFSPDQAGGILLEARNHRVDELNPLQDAFQRASIEGSKLHMQESMRDRSELERESRMPGLEKKKLEHTFADRQRMMEKETDHREALRVAGKDWEADNAKRIEEGKQQARLRYEPKLQKKLHRLGLGPYAKKPLPMSPHPDLPGWMEKHALYLPTNPDQPPALLLEESEGQQGHTKLASLGLLPEVQSFVDGFQGRSGCRYVLVNAMGASEYYGMNANRDAFPEHALVHTPEGWTGGKDPEKDKKLSESCSYGYPTFYRAGVYAHHKNRDHNKRLGDVIFATWNDRMKRVELVLEVEQERAQAHNGAGFWQSLISNQLPAVSMGARVKFDRCSKCSDLTSFYAALKKYDPSKHANPGMAVLEEHMRRRDAAGIPREAKDRVGGIQGIGRTRAEYCDCMRFHAGEVDPLTGLQIFVYNDFPLFFDISLVFVPADKTARGILFLGNGSSSPKTPPTPSTEKRGRLSDMGLVKFAGVAEEVQRYLDPVKPTNTQGATLEGQINLALNGGKQLDGTIRQSSDPMLFVPKDPWSRTSPREDLRHNPSSPNPASQSGRDSGNVAPKIASSPEDKLEALKLARLAKKGEMDKRIEQETPPEELREVARREEDLPKHILDTLGRAPLGAALGSSASLGIVLRPREYQRVALVSMGLPSLADQFEEQRVCFGYQKPSSCPALELLPILAAILAPFLAQRSGFSCLLKDRVVSSLHPRNKASEGGLNKVASLSSELLSTLGASYQGYRAELLNHLAHSQAKLARCQDLELQKVASMQPSELFTPLSFSYFRLAYQDEVAPSTPRTTP